ncbi:MAG: S8 family peptidase [Chitinophagales bacterium]|nr:S8 family peptidase [Chitinophagales bacterium]
MKTALSFVLSFFIFCSHAEIVAVKLCDVNKQEFVKSIKENGGEILTFTEHNEYALIKNATQVNLSSFCYYANVRVKDNVLCFETNKILLKTNGNLSENITKLYKMEANPFIPNIYSIETDAKNIDELNAKINEIKSQNWCAYVQANQFFTMQSTSSDTYYSYQWAIENNGTANQGGGTPGADMSVDSAWTITQGSVSIKIAILDSGVDTTHEDLKPNLLQGYDGFANDTSDTEGYPTPNFSSDGHGTACAGIAAAVADNNKGIAGIANLCQIVPIRIFYYKDYGSGIGVQPTTSTDALLNGSAYAWRYANADVMSVSAGLLPLHIAFLNINTQLVSDEIEAAYYQGRNGFGVPMFFSSGNEDDADVLWPADLYTTIAVGASSMCDERKNPTDCSSENWGSSYGDMLDVVAPGVKIATTDMTGGNGYNSGSYTFTFNGTSAACPNAAGVGALILSVNDSLHARDVKNILRITAERVGAYNYDSVDVYGTWNEEMGYGRINAFEAVKLAQTYESTVPIKQVVSEETKVSIYPNPNEGKVLIINDNTFAVEIDIYDVLGRFIDNISLQTKENTPYYFEQKGYYILKEQQSGKVFKVLVE